MNYLINSSEKGEEEEERNNYTSHKNHDNIFSWHNDLIELFSFYAPLPIHLHTLQWNCFFWK